MRTARSGSRFSADKEANEILGRLYGEMEEHLRMLNELERNAWTEG